MKTYVGKRLNPSEKTLSEVAVYVLDHSTGTRQPLRHRVQHSPDGFNWGYAGSGPADLARSLLADVLGRPPHPSVYQRFNGLHVQKWGDDWQMNDEAIKAEVASILATFKATCPFCLDRGQTIEYCDCAIGRRLRQEDHESTV